MLSRLSRPLLRVFPALLLVLVGLLATLFGRPRGARSEAGVPAPAPAEPAPSPGPRRWAVIAVLALLGIGGGLILAMVDGPIVGRRASPHPVAEADGSRPVTALSRPDVDAERGGTSPATRPDGGAGHAQSTTSASSEAIAPTFDTVRVEPTGDMVVAGRAKPNGIVELLVDGKPTARADVDANGQFAIVSPALPVGNSEVGLRVTDGGGRVHAARESVAVAISPSRDAKPLVAVVSPDRATTVLSQPERPPGVGPAEPDARPGQGAVAGGVAAIRRDPAAGSPGDGPLGGRRPEGPGGSSRAETAAGAARSATAAASPPPGPADPSRVAQAPARPAQAASIRILSVDARGGGRLFVTGRSADGASVRLYLNDTLIAPAQVGRDGTVTFAIGGGVKPGAYTVRLDQVDAASGKVSGRVEVPFSVPNPDRVAAPGPATAAPSDDASSREAGGRSAANPVRPMASILPQQEARTRASGTADGPPTSGVGQPAAGASDDASGAPPGTPADPAIVFVPEVRTAQIERGDSLWKISRRTYGEGDRYTAIYDANQDQIRDPDLIYPGQVFVLPQGDAVAGDTPPRRD